MLTELRNKLGRLRVVVTALLVLVALAPALDALFCRSDDDASAIVMVASTAAPASAPRRSVSHACYCAGHCCPAGMVVQIDSDLKPVVVARRTSLAARAEALVSQSPSTPDRPPRA